jgi:PAS domain S-box-containing protein
VDIRTKLVFALVAVALGSMFAFGAFMFGSADRRFRDNAVSRLDGLAESREAALEEVISGWRERVQLIASRTQLRLSLRDHNEIRDPAAPARIRRILADARASVQSVVALAVYDLEGRLVTDAGPGADGAPQADPASGGRPDAPGEVLFRGVSFNDVGEPRVAFVTDLILDDERLGILSVLLLGRDLIELTRDHTGLGETGEVLIAMRDERGARTLHPVRHARDGSPGSVLLDGAADPALRALSGEEGVFPAGFTDYRGHPVWAAIRFLPETGWGLVVKLDEAEERASIGGLRREMTDIGLALAAFAIVVAVVLGFRFATPIHNLAETANRIRLGDLEARAQASREDEIGFLARTFNQMADELEERVTLLHEYQKFFEVSLDMLCIAGTDGFFKRTNPAFERTLGWGQEQLLDHPFFDLVHPEDLTATRHEIDKLAQGIPTISFVNRFRCADGTYKWLRWTSRPEPDTGLLYAVAREIPDPGAS